MKRQQLTTLPMGHLGDGVPWPWRRFLLSESIGRSCLWTWCHRPSRHFLGVDPSTWLHMVCDDGGDPP
uniref:Uncharacterized protein n=1 Tax=Oryza rufipogon TaxID=4529 RepID=A0A0E0QMY1_ORYRU